MCDCIERIDKQLAAKNARLPVGVNFTTGGADLILRLDKVDSRKKIGSSFIVATHCPFCGLKSRETATEPR
jgi:hypothetical protein